MAGNPGTPSNAYDVVVCEQVLEHLPRIGVAIASLERIAKPGGKVCVGVPIFLSPHVAYALKPKSPEMRGRAKKMTRVLEHFPKEGVDPNGVKRRCRRYQPTRDALS